MATVGDLLVEFAEKPPPDHDLPVLTLTEKNGFVRQQDRFKKRLATEDTSRYKVVHPDDLAFNPYLLWAGAVARNALGTSGIISPLYPTFRVRPGYEPGYVARLLLSPPLVAAYDKIAFGSVPRRRRSSVKDFLGLPVPAQPPLDYQRRAVEALDEADGISRDRIQVLDRLEELVAAVFEARLVDPSHPTEPLRDYIAGAQIGLDRRGADQGPDRAHEYIKMDAIGRRGQLDLTSLTRVDADPRELRKYSVEDGDLLVNTRNSRELVGKSAVYHGEPRLFNNNIMRVRFDPRLRADYVCRYLLSRPGREQLEKRKSGTTNVFALYAKDFSSIEIPVPPETLQVEFERTVRTIATQAAIARAARSTEDEMIAALQAAAFRGEL